MREGQATFFRTDRFRLAGRRDLILKQLFPAQVGLALGRGVGRA